MSTSEQNSNPFNTSAKGYIRQLDYELIKRFRDEHYTATELNYLGLPGADLLDLIAWREFIGPWTGVQLADTPEFAAAADELELNVMRNNLERDFHFVRGNIDDMLSNESNLGQLNWPYTLINLDYVGGLVHAKEDGTSKRLEGLRELFERQRNHRFLLFMTLNLRDKDRGEFDKLLHESQSSLIEAGCTNVTERWSEHLAFGNAGKLKIYLPIFLGINARHFRISLHAPILYQGSKQMMHFAIEFQPYSVTSSGNLFSLKEQIDLINLPLLTSNAKDDLHKNSLGPLIKLPGEE